MQSVYVKSEKALKEFEQGNRSLSLRHRHLLIMVDGKRSVSDIAKIFDSQEVVQTLVDLEKLGFLVDSKKSENHLKNSNDSNRQVAVIDDALSKEHVLFIKIFLIEQVQLHLALMGRDIERKITNVSNSNDLKSCIAVWHMAIRDSRNGRTIADKLMERLTHLMANPPQKLASEHAS